MEFFSEMASLYGGYNNVIYEIYNEPVNTGWPQSKAYAEQVIPAIRQRDPDNLIVVATPFYSQEVDVASADPIDDNNVAYTLHFYAASHGDDLRNRATTAMNVSLRRTCMTAGRARAIVARVKAGPPCRRSSLDGSCRATVPARPPASVEPATGAAPGSACVPRIGDPTTARRCAERRVVDNVVGWRRGGRADVTWEKRKQ